MSFTIYRNDGGGLFNETLAGILFVRLRNDIVGVNLLSSLMPVTLSLDREHVTGNLKIPYCRKMSKNTTVPSGGARVGENETPSYAGEIKLRST